MGSVNPVFVLPGALRARGDEIASGLAQSVTLGVGQFCTNPGVVVGLDVDEFAGELATQLGDVPPRTMLYPGIGERYAAGVGDLAQHRRCRAAHRRADRWHARVCA